MCRTQLERARRADERVPFDASVGRGSVALDTGR